jgi:signal transduction histidine kinase
VAVQAAKSDGPALTRASRELWLDVAVAVAIFAGTVALLAVGEADAGDRIDAVGLVLCAAASLPLAARRRAPIAVFVLTGLASVALHGAADPTGPPLGPTLALYWMVAAGDESRGRTRLMLALTVPILLSHISASGLATDRFPGAEALFGVLVWGGAWVAGERTRLRRERMVELEERARRAEHEAERDRRLAAAEERAHIARDLHDSAGHAINVILVHAGLGRLRAEDPPAVREAFETIEDVARETVGEIDQMVRALRDDATIQGANGVEPPPGIAAVEALLKRHRAAGMDVAATVHGELRALPPAIDRAAYRILQEALTNAARHGNGRATLQIAVEPDELVLTVENPLDTRASRAADSGGHGIVGMRERAALLGGTLEANFVGSRFRAHARLPIGDRRG